MAAADERIFHDQQHPISKRFAILEANDACAWLYLTSPGEPKPEQDAFAFSPGPIVTKERAKSAAEMGKPPPLAAQYASPDAVLKRVKPEELSFKWSADGQSVAVLRKRHPLAMIVAGKRRGYSN